MKQSWKKEMRVMDPILGLMIFSLPWRPRAPHVLQVRIGPKERHAVSGVHERVDPMFLHGPVRIPPWIRRCEDENGVFELPIRGRHLMAGRASCEARRAI